MKIELRGITKRFPGVIANKDVDLTVNSGEVHALLGENGAGKSTLMNVLYGLYEPTEGEILVDDKPVKFKSPGDAIASAIGMVHQHFMLVPVFTVTENVMLGVEPTQPLGLLDTNQARARLVELSEKFGSERKPRCDNRGSARRGPATSRDPEGALPQGRLSDPRRADRRPHSGRDRRSHRGRRDAQGHGSVDHLHLPQAQRGHGDRRSHNGPASRRSGRLDHSCGDQRAATRRDDGRSFRPADRRQGTRTPWRPGSRGKWPRGSRRPHATRCKGCRLRSTQWRDPGDSRVFKETVRPS